jgi:hypothetical protein
LLSVLPIHGDKPPGHAEDARGGLLLGYVARFAPYDNAADADHASWLAVCMKTPIVTKAQKR